MAYELKQQLKLAQQLVMTPQLQQAIKLLQLSRLELENVINKEMLENPVLEEVSEEQEGGKKGEEKTAEQVKKEQIVEEGKDSFDWESYIESYNPSSTTSPIKYDEVPSYENILTRTTTLTDHLMWQLKLSTLSEEEERIGTLIIGNLSDDGYFLIPLEEFTQKEKIDLKLCEGVLKKIQEFDPLGVGSRTLKECLLIQARQLEIRDNYIEEIINNHLSDLEKRNYPVIAKALGVSVDKVIERTKIILDMEPKPGRSFSGPDTHYIIPDVYVYKMGDEFVIVLNEDGLPKLRISQFYKNLLQGQVSSTLTKDYIQEKLRSAIWLIRSIHQRQRTIYKVTESIVKNQRDFFEKGVTHLKPMILRDVANDIGMHESTVSRVTTNKYVHTPMGIFELKYFFNTSVGSGEGLDIASESIKERIRRLLTSEDPKKPYSDQKIVELLKAQNIDIARRTVAKYRDLLGILPSSKRKKYYD